MYEHHSCTLTEPEHIAVIDFIKLKCLQWLVIELSAMSATVIIDENLLRSSISDQDGVAS